MFVNFTIVDGQGITDSGDVLFDMIGTDAVFNDGTILSLTGELGFTTAELYPNLSAALGQL